MKVRIHRRYFGNLWALFFIVATVIGTIGMMFAVQYALCKSTNPRYSVMECLAP